MGNTFQATILDLFNTNESLSCKEIMDRGAISESDFKEAMLKLCNPKNKVLLKENAKVPKFNPNEKISVNSKFEHNNIRLNLIPVITTEKIMEGAGGNKSLSEIDNEVLKERGLVIDAMLVRVMKARKQEQYNLLVNEVIKQIKIFQAQPPMIKKRIDHLIEREYIERDKNDKKKLIYKP